MKLTSTDFLCDKLSEVKFYKILLMFKRVKNNVN